MLLFEMLSGPCFSQHCVPCPLKLILGTPLVLHYWRFVMMTCFWMGHLGIASLALPRSSCEAWYSRTLYKCYFFPTFPTIQGYKRCSSTHPLLESHLVTKCSIAASIALATEDSGCCEDLGCCLQSAFRELP